MDSSEQDYLTGDREEIVSDTRVGVESVTADTHARATASSPDVSLPPVSTFTVVIPTFNGKGIVEGAVRSVLQQIGVSWDLVVIDDGSSDGTYDSVSTLVRGDGRVRVVRNHRNLGIARTLNRGIGMAEGQWLLILHQDCRLESQDWLARAVEALRSSSATCLVGRPHHDIRSMSRSEKWFWIIRNHVYVGDTSGRSPGRDLLFSENKCDVFQTEFLRSLGGFDENILGGGEDQVLADRLAQLQTQVLRPDGLGFTLTLGSDTSIRRNLRKDYRYAGQMKQVLRRTRLRAVRRSAGGSIDRRLTNRLFGVAWILATVLLVIAVLVFPIVSPVFALAPPLLRWVDLEFRAMRVRRAYQLHWTDLMVIPFVGLLTDLSYFVGLVAPNSAAHPSEPESERSAALRST